MPYPVSGVHSTVTIAFEDQSPLTEELNLTLSTHTTIYAMNNSVFVLWDRTVDVIAEEQHIGQQEFVIDNNRRWNGVGQTFYIPSFPQLERNATTWPHAT